MYFTELADDGGGPPDSRRYVVGTYRGHVLGEAIGGSRQGDPTQSWRLWSARKRGCDHAVDRCSPHQTRADDSGAACPRGTGGAAGEHRARRRLDLAEPASAGQRTEIGRVRRCQHWLGGWSGGTIIKTADGGTTWALQTSGTTTHLYSVVFVDTTTGWAVGGGYDIAGKAYYNCILKDRRRGPDMGPAERWNRLPTLFGGLRRHHSTGWAVGEMGTIVKTTDGGTTWTQQKSGTTSNLSSVVFIDTNTGWVTCPGIERILKTTDGGATWTAQSSGSTKDFYSVAFADASTGWVVGGDWDDDWASTGGAILRTTDGGNTWTPQDSGTTERLNSVAFARTQGTRLGGGCRGHHPEDCRWRCDVDTIRTRALRAASFGRLHRRQNRLGGRSVAGRF